MKGYEIPEYGRTAKGLPIVNLLKLDDGEKLQQSSMLTVTKRRNISSSQHATELLNELQRVNLAIFGQMV